MITVDEFPFGAPLDVCFAVAADVERWPSILPHYRHVRFLHRTGFAAGRVEMAAWRPFLGPVRYPTWWASDMSAEADTPIIRFRHVDGITRGMDVRWEFFPTPAGTHVRITHEWAGPHWPLVGVPVASRIIGPHFISAIARRTLAGLAAEARARARDPDRQRNRAPDRAPIRDDAPNPEPPRA